VGGVGQHDHDERGQTDHDDVDLAAQSHLSDPPSTHGQGEMGIGSSSFQSQFQCELVVRKRSTTDAILLIWVHHPWVHVTNAADRSCEIRSAGDAMSSTTDHLGTAFSGRAEVLLRRLSRRPRNAAA
jgi:hypothetical protein